MMATDAGSGRLERVGVEDARKQIAGGEAQAIDVRGEDAWRESHIPGAVTAVERLEEGQRVILVADGDPPNEVTEALLERGFDVALLDGGMDAWKGADFTLQPSDDVDEDAEPEAVPGS